MPTLSPLPPSPCSPWNPWRVTHRSLLRSTNFELRLHFSSLGPIETLHFWFCTQVCGWAGGLPPPATPSRSLTPPPVPPPPLTFLFPLAACSRSIEELAGSLGTPLLVRLAACEAPGIFPGVLRGSLFSLFMEKSGQLSRTVNGMRAQPSQVSRVYSRDSRGRLVLFVLVMQPWDSPRRCRCRTFDSRCCVVSQAD